MTMLMRSGRDRRSENPRSATREKNACCWLGPISGSHQGQRPQRLHSKAGYMAAPERFAKASDSFPLHRGRRPYMALPGTHVRALRVLDQKDGSHALAANQPSISGELLEFQVGAC